MSRASRLVPAALALVVLAAPVAVRADPETRAMAEAQKLADQQKWDAATAAARGAGGMGRAVIEWERLRAGAGDFSEYGAFLQRHPDWPGLGLLRYKGEGAIKNTTPPTDIIAYFAGHAPRTSDGSLAYQRALAELGKTHEAEAEARRAWLSLSYDKSAQAEELKRYARLLAPDNDRRLERLLWRGQTTEATRMLPYASAGAVALAKARIALQTGRENGLNDLIRAVPKAEADDAGLAFDRFRYRLRHDKNDWAAQLMLERSRSARSLGEPSAWAHDRAALARAEMTSGNPHMAYRLAAEHHLKPGAAYAEMEFLAGYIALRKLHEPALALRHFRALAAAVTTPISSARAAYWEGRAEDALGKTTSARDDYLLGARYQTAFYGLLSAEKAGLALDPALLARPNYPDWRHASFLHSPLIHVALLLDEAGDHKVARHFFLQAAERLKTEELGPFADFAMAHDDPDIAVLAAKLAAGRGVILPRAYFPVTRLARADLPISADLALAIARRESEFDVSIVSPAGALGLMQLMPATARSMSRSIGLAFDEGRLTTDGSYNAKIGGAYLAKLIDRFGPALTLVAAGYNAGPGRAASWVSKYGDPRSPDVDPVDWIESIPYNETRNYIMRVAESYEIYRSKLAGHPLKIRLMAELKGR
ncbi:lytic transglycosylase domain-containing protein [Solirhodobacter olei]|uniref:lytic transglycosylase domain-containing protein n=1 Tax=Solirhodobacter olei TaxID=2493082 RepID=UPI000FDA584C|nr:lytic transglycosylase domain-containing protein [Solirhodobacter olei]